jgi:transcriptional regulator with XRE-family HTH domain
LKAGGAVTDRVAPRNALRAALEFHTGPYISGGMAKKKEPPPAKKPRRPRKMQDKSTRAFIEEISAALMKMRKSSGLTQAQLGMMTRSSQASVHRTETAVAGLRAPDFDRLRRCAKAMGWQMKVVFTEPEPGAKSVVVDKPAPNRKKIVGPVVPQSFQKVKPFSLEDLEPPGAW